LYAARGQSHVGINSFCRSSDATQESPTSAKGRGASCASPSPDLGESCATRKPPLVAHPLTGVAVELRGCDQSFSSQTDEKGVYWFYGLPAGTYKFVAALPSIHILGCRWPMSRSCWDINYFESRRSTTLRGSRLAKSNLKPLFVLLSNDTILIHQQININKTHVCSTIETWRRGESNFFRALNLRNLLILRFA
jgi:hypothetical protein